MITNKSPQKFSRGYHRLDKALTQPMHLCGVAMVPMRGSLYSYRNVRRCWSIACLELVDLSRCSMSQTGAYGGH